MSIIGRKVVGMVVVVVYCYYYDMIYLTAIRLTPGGSSTVNIYTQTIHRTTQSTQNNTYNNAIH